MYLSEVVLDTTVVWISINMKVNNGTTKVPISSEIGVRVQ